MWKLLLVLAVLVVPASANAQADYRCVVERVASVSKKTDAFMALGVGKEFTVDRRTGVMVGALKNSNAYTQPKVIDPGSVSNAFKVITMSGPLVDHIGPGSYVELLQINEFEAGPKKGFMFASTYVGGAYFGTCKHF